MHGTNPSNTKTALSQEHDWRQKANKDVTAKLQLQPGEQPTMESGQQHLHKEHNN